MTDEGGILRRPRIDNLLESALEKPVITVTAGPGCGKTHAVYAYLQSSQIRTIWVQLSASDNSPARFWENFALAVSRRSATLADAVRSLSMPTNQSELSVFAGMLADEIKPRYRYALVFDDLHLVHEASVRWFIRALTYGIWSGSFEQLRAHDRKGGSAPGGSLILITREDCGFDSESLVAEGRMAQIGEQELSFTKSETLELFRFMGIPVTPALQSGLDGIYADTKGWAFMTGMAGRLLQKRPDGVKYIKSTLRYNMSKLIENEIFLHNSPEINKFLSKLSLIGYLSADLISRLEDGDRLIKELMRCSSLVRYDAYMNVYHIHHLMQEFLLEQRDLLTREEKRDVYLTAARWCLEHEQKMDAAGYYARAEDYDAVVGIVYQFPQIIPFDQARLLFELLDGAPTGWESIWTHYRSHYRARLLLCLGRIDEAIGATREILRQLEPLEDSPDKRRNLLGAYYMLGSAHMLACNDTGDYGFAAYFQKAEAYLEGSGFTPLGSMRVATVAPYTVRIGRGAKGEPEKYIEALARAVPAAARIMDGCMAGLDDLARAELAYYQADIARCRQFAMQALFVAREKGQHEIESRALFYLMRAGLAAGKYEPVKEAVRQMIEQLDTPEFINRYIRFDIQTGWFYGSIGQREHIADWLKSDFSASRSETVISNYEDFARAKYFLLEQDYRGMLAMLSSRGGGFSIGRYLFGQIGLEAYRAVCLYNLREPKEAFEALRGAYELAAPNSLDMIFIEMGNHMRTLVAAARGTAGFGIPDAWLERIQKKAATYAKRVGQVKSQYRLAEGIDGSARLTQKELDLLRDLSHGLSRSEIALARGNSISTVKTMLQYIYEKLGAENSMDAVRLAVAKGML
ncbi:MAG: LuxR C-terminal-related transcriptional regulator [Oscillospiraceae bacterium]|nr:LuxR C-terminal-related transcriptional regulator [Oscillospiraceae bacterium]